MNQWHFSSLSNLPFRAINHDPTRHPDADIFLPERYLGDDTNAAESATLPYATKRGTAGYQLKLANISDHFTFGAGRRICSGIHLAENSLFILTGI